MQAIEITQQILKNYSMACVPNAMATAFAPVNIALCKYWGKRDSNLNLPMTSSLSISLDKLGALTQLTYLNSNLNSKNNNSDEIHLNQTRIANTEVFAERIINFLNLFRPNFSGVFRVDTKINIPVSAGLASSAAGFAALTLALNKLFGWNLSVRALSILARLGSGSACRSIEKGFIKWERGTRKDGMDSFAHKLNYAWEELQIGLLMISKAPKAISSRDAMKKTVETSILYTAWEKQVDHDLGLLEQAIAHHDFRLLGETVEANALAMHATMLSAREAICYFQPETIACIQKIWALRKTGLNLYFTQDAGPNLKLLFLKKDKADVLMHFPGLIKARE